MTAPELLRSEASDLEERAAVADVLTGDEPAGVIAEKARQVESFRERAAALRALAARWDAEEARVTAIRDDPSVFTEVAMTAVYILTSLARLDAPLVTTADAPPERKP